MLDHDLLSRFVGSSSDLELTHPMEKGDFVGHPFRGNQWSDASGASSALAGSSETQRDRDLDQSGREGASKLNRQIVFDAANMSGYTGDQSWLEINDPVTGSPYMNSQTTQGEVKSAVVKNLAHAIRNIVSAKDILDADWASLRASTTDANGNVDETPDYYSANPVYANIKSLVAQDGYCQLFRDGQGLVAVPADSTLYPQNKNGSPEFVGFYPKDSTGRSMSQPADAIRESIVNDVVKSWALTSNDSHPLSLAVQAVAATVFNVSGAMEWGTGKGGAPRPSSGLAKQPSWINDKQFHVIAEVLKAQHAATQAYFKKKGIQYLQIFRGQQNQPTYFDEEERVEAESGQKAEILTRPLSSWSFDRSIAAEFAGIPFREFDSRDPTLIMAATVPVKQILSIPITGAGCLNEKEAILIADSVMARATTGGKRDDVSWNPVTSTVKP